MTANPADSDRESALSADMSAAEIDIRCALVLGRIALETLAELNPDASARIMVGLDRAMDDARLEGSRGYEAVIGLLTEIKHRLEHADDQNRVWYVE